MIHRAHIPRALPSLARTLPVSVLPALVLLAVALLALLALGACERSGTSAPPPAAPGSPAATESQAAPGSPEHTNQEPGGLPVILILGDSLTAGFGLPSELSFPSLIQERLWQEGYPHRVVNAGVSGDTSAGGLARLDWVLKGRVDLMVLALGANDGLRGQPPEALRDNLAAIIQAAKARGIPVLLAGMRMPANYGQDYARRFAAVYPELAEAFDVPLLPFLLEGVAMQPDLNQADGIHPNAEGARIVADNVWQALKPLLKR